MKNTHQKDYWSQPAKSVAKAKISKPFLVVSRERNVKKNGMVFVSLYQNIPIWFKIFLVALPHQIHERVKRRKKKKPTIKQQENPCAFLHTCVRLFTEQGQVLPHVFEERRGHMPRVFRQKRVNFREHCNWWHGENHSWKRSSFFISSKTKPVPNWVRYAPESCQPPPNFGGWRIPSLRHHPRAVPPTLPHARLQLLSLGNDKSVSWFYRNKCLWLHITIARFVTAKVGSLLVFTSSAQSLPVNQFVVWSIQVY